MQYLLEWRWSVSNQHRWVDISIFHKDHNTLTVSEQAAVIQDLHFTLNYLCIFGLKRTYMLQPVKGF